MTDIKNPFSPDDVIWFERGSKPYAVFTVNSEGLFVDIYDGQVYDIKQLITFFQPDSSGPYRLAQAENWSGYFTKYGTLRR